MMTVIGIVWLNDNISILLLSIMTNKIKQINRVEISDTMKEIVAMDKEWVSVSIWLDPALWEVGISDQKISIYNDEVI